MGRGLRLEAPCRIDICGDGSPEEYPEGVIPKRRVFHQRREGYCARLLGPKDAPREIFRSACNAAPLKMTPIH